MSKTPRILDIERVVHGNKVKTDFITAPHTQIVNEQGEPRKIPDLANNLKPSFGVERVTTSSIKRIENEFGPSGESVFEVSNRDTRIRFVGNWSNISDNNGFRVNANGSSNQFVEITFYGTGLNAVAYTNLLLNGAYSVDGGSETILNTTSSTILGTRNYNPNTVISIVSGLSLGIHTVKIKANSGPVAFYGFEILNESTQLVLNPGQPFVGGKGASLDVQSLFDVKPPSLIGTKGGRVIVYLTEEGNPEQVVQAVDVNDLYLTNTNHVNEEIFRSVNFREFGKNRGDDFSTIGTGSSDRAFTLDDGTTTLIGDNVSSDPASGDGLRCNTTGFWTFTFVGTGLDILRFDTANGGNNLYEISVDETVVGNLDSTGVNSERIEKICSGLPYGTHIVKIRVVNTQVTYTLNCLDFIVYQPKKPTLPSGAIELADYNVMADFVANDTASVDTIATGVLRKSATREFTYGGTWVGVNTVNPPLNIGGFEVQTNSATAYFEYTFFGTGFEHRFAAANNRSSNITVSVDGNSDFSSFNTSFYGTGVNFTAATGLLDQNNAVSNYGSGLSVSGLPLGLHTVRFTVNDGNYLVVESLDIITPVHINSTDFKTGSLSLSDLRSNPETKNSSKNKYDPTKIKAWAILRNGNLVKSYNISAYLDNGSQNNYFYFKHPFKDRNYGYDWSGASSQGYIANEERIQKNYCIITGVNTTGGGVSAGSPYQCVVFYGELENEEDLDLGDL